MTLAHYAAIWLSLLLFTLAELGRRRELQGRALTWPRRLSSAGLALLVVHMAITFAIVHGWQLDRAIAATAVQTRATYGLDEGRGFFVNLVFAAVWALDVMLWPRRLAGAAVRVFYLVVIANGAVIFAAPSRRWLGALIVIALVAAWRPRS